jgi:hypothetical protein
MANDGSFVIGHHGPLYREHNRLEAAIIACSIRVLVYDWYIKRIPANDCT